MNYPTLYNFSLFILLFVKIHEFRGCLYTFLNSKLYCLLFSKICELGYGDRVIAFTHFFITVLISREAFTHFFGCSLGDVILKFNYRVFIKVRKARGSFSLSNVEFVFVWEQPRRCKILLCLFDVTLS